MSTLLLLPGEMQCTVLLSPVAAMCSTSRSVRGQGAVPRSRRSRTASPSPPAASSGPLAIPPPPVSHQGLPSTHIAKMSTMAVNCVFGAVPHLAQRWPSQACPLSLVAALHRLHSNKKNRHICITYESLFYGGMGITGPCTPLDAVDPKKQSRARQGRQVSSEGIHVILVQFDGLLQLL
jgi:hypothetical protein